MARAKADAAQIVEQGKATAKVLTDLSQTYRATGGGGRDVLLMQKLVPILRDVTGTIGALRVDRLTVLGKDANGSPNGGGNLARGLVSTNEQVKAAIGVDVARVLRDKLGETGEVEPPPVPRRSSPPMPAGVTSPNPPRGSGGSGR